MRILHSVHDYLPEQVAGVEVYTSRIAHRQSQDHEVGLLFAVLAPDRPDASVEIGREARVETFGLVQNRRWSRFEQTWLDAKLAPAIGRVLDRFAPDVLHVQHLMNLGLGVVHEARRRGIPIVMTLHDQWLACANGGQRFRADRQRCDELDARRCARCTHSMVGPALALRGRGQRRRARAREQGGEGGPASQIVVSPGEASAAVSASKWLRAGWAGLVGGLGGGRIEARWRAMRALGDEVDRFIAPSQDMRAAAIEFGLPAERVLRLPYGMPRQVAPRSRALPEHASRFAYLGSLVPHKGVHDLVCAFESLPATARLDVFGSQTDAPGYVAELRRAIRHPGIRLRGEIAPDRVPDLLGEIDCLVSPSIWRENAPLSVQEALGAGTPVIASDLGGHGELLAEGGGLLFEAGNVEALARVLGRLVSEAGLARKLGGSAMRLTSVEEHAVALDDVYRSLV
jgi:glycosyltransferase involved in cell wall biosynthesis